jgi:hypothetical protein
MNNKQNSYNIWLIKHHKGKPVISQFQGKGLCGGTIEIENFVMYDISNYFKNI